MSSRLAKPRVWMVVLGVSASPCMAAGPLAPQRPANIKPHINLFETAVGLWDAGIELALNFEALTQAREAEPGFLASIPLDRNRSVDVELHPFKITGPRTQIVVGHGAHGDTPYAFDLTQLTFLRGMVQGYAGSHVFLALSQGRSVGYVDLGAGRERFEISSDIRGLAPGRALVFKQPTASDGGGPLTCETPPRAHGVQAASGAAGTRGSAGNRMRFLELAIETDYEFFQLFNDLDAALTFLLQLEAEISDIYVRDVDIRIELTFVRLWNTPTMPFFTHFTALEPFKRFWRSNMNHVHRDVVKLLSGHESNAGGSPGVSLCDDHESYYICGKTTRVLPDPETPDRNHWDIYVNAHELGHNCGSPHSQDYSPPINSCAIPPHRAERGTVMSYCNRENGGLANHDWRFHVREREVMRAYVGTTTCVPYDCNFNSMDDAIDIQSGVSLDGNANGIPDECEDCNANGIRDDIDLASGDPYWDADQDGIPDLCEPDCNFNSLPDDLDIALSSSLDANGNRVPDECEENCDADGLPDHVEIQADMELDIDRNARLDACQDCDADGVPDIAELAGGHNLWLVTASSGAGAVLTEFHAAAGVRVRTSTGTAVSGTDLRIGPNGHIFVAATGGRILQFSADGVFVTTFVPTGSGGLVNAVALVFRPNGNLLVANADTAQSIHNVLEYSGSDGSFVGQFVAGGSGGLIEPGGLTFSPNGNLLISCGMTSADSRVLEYDGQTGAFVRVLVPVGSGGLARPRGMTFIANGHLLVASPGSENTLEFDGNSGDFLGVFDDEVTQPWALRVGPNSNVLIGSPGDGVAACLVREMEVRNNHWLRHSFVCGLDLNIQAARSFDFVPGWGTDCNVNGLPDNCDIASGASLDANFNGTPDECEVDCNGNGRYDRLDIIPFGASYDCNFNGIPDECITLEIDCNSNAIPDACEVDCNGNSTHDGCDIAGGTSHDCNGNGVPDECETDCNANGFFDACDVAGSTSQDCSGNGIPDECEVDCNGNGVADSCDDFSGTSRDCDGDGELEECAFQDCNGNGIADRCDIADGTSEDCDAGPSHSCCMPRFNPGCSDPVIEACVCAVDSFCCTAFWDSACVDGVAGNACGNCGGNGIPDECETDPSLFGPLPRSACEGESVALTVSAIGTLPLSYQWRKDGNPIPGATTPSLSFASCLAADEGIYDVVVTNGCNIASISAAAFLAIHTVADCDDESVCTADGCSAGNCTHTPSGNVGAACTDADPCTINEACDALGDCEGMRIETPYGDIVPPPFGNGLVDVDDLLRVLSGFVDPSSAPEADLSPCGGDGIIDVDDILVLLNAFTGIFVCDDPCPPCIASPLDSLLKNVGHRFEAGALATRQTVPHREVRLMQLSRDEDQAAGTSAFEVYRSMGNTYTGQLHDGMVVADDIQITAGQGCFMSRIDVKVHGFSDFSLMQLGLFDACPLAGGSMFLDVLTNQPGHRIDLANGAHVLSFDLEGIEEFIPGSFWLGMELTNGANPMFGSAPQIGFSENFMNGTYQDLFMCEVDFPFVYDAFHANIFCNNALIAGYTSGTAGGSFYGGFGCCAGTLNGCGNGIDLAFPCEKAADDITLGVATCRLKRYTVEVTGTGGPFDIEFELWTDEAGHPGTPIPGTRGCYQGHGSGAVETARFEYAGTKSLPPTFWLVWMDDDDDAGPLITAAAPQLGGTEDSYTVYDPATATWLLRNFGGCSQGQCGSFVVRVYCDGE